MTTIQRGSSPSALRLGRRVPGPAVRTDAQPAANFRDRRGRLIWSWLVPAAICILAFCCRLVPTVTGTGLFSRDGYDPYVYYAAAVATFTGHLPYRDFLFLHPPGIIVALQPFAAIGAIFGDPIGMAAARVGFMCVGTLSCLLVYRLLLRTGRSAALLGATVYAIWYPAVNVERTVRLEAVATLLVLIGLVFAQRAGAGRRAPLWALVAGAAFTLAATVKIWGVVPLAVLLVWLLISHGWRIAAHALVGATAAIAVVLGPLVVLAPQWWRMVVLDQLGRNRVDVTAAVRVAQTVGLPDLVDGGAGPVLFPVAAGLVLIALVVAWRRPEARLYVLLTLATGAVLMASPSWFPHYPALAAAPICLVLGVAAGTVIDSVRPRAVRIGVGIAGTAAVAIAGASFLPAGGVSFDGPALARILAARTGCITTDTAASLVLSDTLRRNLAGGCRIVVDLTGYSYEPSTTRTGPNREQDPTFQNFAMAYLRSGTSTIVIRLHPDGFTSHRAATIESWPVVGTAGDVVVREPKP